MIKLKKYLLIALVLSCFLITSSVPTIYSQQATDDKKVEFTFDSQCDVLKNEMFPEIKKYIEDFDYKFDAESSNVLIGGVATIVVKYLKENKITFFQAPTIEIYRYNNGIQVAYTLQIKMFMPDSSASTDKFIATMYIGKTFLIKIKNLKQSEI